MGSAAHEKRRAPRIEMHLPVRIGGIEPHGGDWEEMTETQEASEGGTSFTLKRRVEKGQLLHLTLPLPKQLRRFDPVEHYYSVYSLVRTIHGKKPPYRVGVLFFGKEPPKDFHRHPGMRYLLPNDPMPKQARQDRRHSRRYSIFLNLKLRRLESGQEELTVAENVSKGGAQVMTSLPVEKGELVEVIEVGGDFRSKAEIRNRYLGEDQIPRLNLQFLESELPDRILPATDPPDEA